MVYEGDIYRPPSEAYSLIIQVTVGCSHNKCTFCSMYKDKRFHIRQPEDVIKDLEEMRTYYSRVGRIFLADGDALCLANSKLLPVLEAIRRLFPECERVAVYGSALDALRKTPAELEELRDAGVGIIYIGAESGNPEVLRRVKKSGTREQLIDGVRAIEDAGIRASVTFISGLGGQELWREHAEDSASMLNAMQPYYASLLTLMVEPIAPLYKDIQEGRFKYLTPAQVMDETELFLTNVDLKKPCVFRSNHASNYLSLRGDLPADKELMLAQIREARKHSSYKPEFFRAL
jgi:radical SAM superfamily enzyme YgiQ (UPF0313 family)